MSTMRKLARNGEKGAGRGSPSDKNGHGKHEKDLATQRGKARTPRGKGRGQNPEEV